ncbi:MAG: ABC transporter ATP-binding protein [Minisyncoccia bacterium]
MITVKNLTKKFVDGEKETLVLKGIDCEIKDGEWVAIMGRSGAGKSTLMYQISLLDEPSTGEIIINDENVLQYSNDEKTDFRLTKLGYVFQDYALLPELTALENVSIPLMMQGYSMKEAHPKAAYALERVGLGDKLHNLPSQLSGGQQQRVSISRAIAHEPSILFADEPTANLDNESSERVMDIFEELHKAGQTLIMVTHEEEFGRRADRVIRLDNGLVVPNTKAHH